MCGASVSGSVETEQLASTVTRMLSVAVAVPAWVANGRSARARMRRAFFMALPSVPAADDAAIVTNGPAVGLLFDRGAEEIVVCGLVFLHPQLALALGFIAMDAQGIEAADRLVAIGPGLLGDGDIAVGRRDLVAVEAATLVGVEGLNLVDEGEVRSVHVALLEGWSHPFHTIILGRHGRSSSVHRRPIDVGFVPIFTVSSGHRRTNKKPGMVPGAGLLRLSCGPSLRR